MFDSRSAARLTTGRSAPLTAVLVATVALSLGLGYAAYASGRDYRAAVEATLADYTGMAARELSRLSRESMDWLVDEALVDNRRRWSVHAEPDAIARAMAEALARHDCPCRALRTPTVTYEAQAATGTVLLSHDAPPRLLPGSILDALRRAGVALTARGHGVVVAPAGTVLDRPAAVAYATAGGRDPDAVTIRGFVVSLEGIGELVEHWYENNALLPDAPGRTSVNDSLFHAVVRTADGDLVFASARGEREGLASRDTLGVAWGGLDVEVDLRRGAAARLVAGGLPASRAPLYVGLLALVAVVGAAGLLQIRREQELARLRDDFVSGVSHELRTPLTQIRMFAELHGADKLRTEEDRRRAIAVIDREARRLSHLVESVLQFTRLRRGPGRAIATGPVDVRQVVDEAVEGFGPLLTSGASRVEVDVDPGLAAAVPADSIRQILVNLLDNALKYGAPGQTVRVRASGQDDRVRFTVDDEGPGIPARDRARVWAPYRRLKQHVGRATGTGLGLAVVAELARGYRGAAWVEDAPGGGARMVVELPASPDAPVPAQGPA